MFYSSLELRAKSWMDEAKAMRERGLYHLADTCEAIAASFLTLEN